MINQEQLNMSFRILSLIILIVTPLSFAYARKPAVEDFVGIEIEHPEGTPQGTEGLFNFEKDINHFEQNKNTTAMKEIKETPVAAETTKGGFTTVMGIFFLLGLPAAIWLFMVNNLRQKAHIESASNIEVLEKYRREKQEARKAEEKFNKAS